MEDRNLPEDDEMYSWKDPQGLPITKWVMDDYEYQSIMDGQATWAELWSIRCGGRFKYIGQFWEWLEENFHPPIRKQH